MRERKKGLRGWIWICSVGHAWRISYQFQARWRLSNDTLVCGFLPRHCATSDTEMAYIIVDVVRVFIADLPPGI